MTDVASSSGGRDANDYGRFNFAEMTDADMAAAWGAGGGADDPQAQAMRQMTGCSHDKSSERAIFDLPIEDKVRRIRKHHERGNAFFDEGQYARAAVQYRSANVIYDYTFPDDDATWAIIDGLRTTCNLNAAACNLKVGAFDEALQNCYEVLRADPQNVKALYRRARVRRHRHEYGKARADILAALRLLPHDFQLREEHAALRAEVAAYNTKNKAMAARMMRNSSSSSSSSSSNLDDTEEGQANAADTAAKAGSSTSSSSSSLLHPPRPPPMSWSEALGIGEGAAAALSVDDLYEPVLFDTAPILADEFDWESGGAGGGAEAPAPSQQHQDQQVSGQDGGGGGGGSSGGGNGGGGAPSGGGGKFVFGDLNRPGAFVPQRRRRHKPGGEVDSSPCLCCA